ncbi:formate dehydrogenase subunit delta [Novispirillum itersonii]|uniref:formate dehydrogenase subunit delta n=1 Tax=Novispirillum itersonii TaxID=189 RepID=UPI0003807AFE|nr:formate dehydrogenase subunit delta [Novispirillum itersonii]
MDTADLVRMANQIAAYFRSYPEAEAVSEISQHIKSFWDPRMRQGLDALMASGGEELDPLVRRAFPPQD